MNTRSVLGSERDRSGRRPGKTILLGAERATRASRSPSATSATPATMFEVGDRAGRCRYVSGGAVADLRVCRPLRIVRDHGTTSSMRS